MLLILYGDIMSLFYNFVINKWYENDKNKELKKMILIHS